jgi:Trk K+ transport system NAD-binding subunit
MEAGMTDDAEAGTVDAPDPERFVLTGTNKLMARVAAALHERGATVAVLTGDTDDDDRQRGLDFLPDGVTVVDDRDRTRALRAAGLRGATGLVVLGPDDEDNLRWAMAAADVDSAVPVVLRMFDPAFADHLGDRHNIRRSYSLSALAAPTFVAAALGESVVETLRLGDAEVVLAIFDVGGHESESLQGHTPDQVKTRTGCAVVAAGREGRWSANPPDHPLVQGEQVLVGGLLLDVLRLARNHRVDPPVLRGPRPPRVPSPLPTWHRALLPICLATFLGLLAVTTAVYASQLHLGVVAAAETALAATLGSPPTENHSTLTSVFTILTTLAGLLVVSVLVSIVAARLIEERLEERMGRQALRRHDHVIVAGLGRVGFRVVRLLRRLDLDAVVLERDPDSAFTAAIADRVPVLKGDARFEENLLRAGVDRARCLIACTDDDISNLSACLEARRLRPGIRTVARVFDEELATVTGPALGIDAVRSASDAGCSAFVAAATDGRAARTIILGDLELRALRLDADHDIAPETIERWRQRGLRILARHAPGGVVEPPAAAMGRGLAPGERAVVIAPRELTDEVAASLRAP